MMLFPISVECSYVFNPSFLIYFIHLIGFRFVSFRFVLALIYWLEFCCLGSYLFLGHPLYTPLISLNVLISPFFLSLSVSCLKKPKRKKQKQKAEQKSLIYKNEIVHSDTQKFNWFIQSVPNSLSHMKMKTNNQK